MIKTRVTELLGIETPILEGGMAIAGNGELAAAVSNGGGLGVVSSNPGWSKQSERTENVRAHLRRAKALTDKPLCANISLQLIGKNPERHLDMLVEEGVKIVVTSGGSPGVLSQKAKDLGLTVMHVVANVRQARRSEDSGVDIVICEGYEAGGIEGADEITSMVLIPSVVEAVSVPVVGAGGIGNGRGMVAALALGAEGIQMGSAFLATRECHVHQNFKQAIVEADDTGTVMIQRMIGRLSRVIKTPRALQFQDMDKRGAASEMQEFMAATPSDSNMEGAPTMDAQWHGQMGGDMENGEAAAGQSIAFVQEIKSASDVVRDITAEAEALLDEIENGDLRRLRA
jgi:enoyl-[acyl-carrier protein] reductase II